MEFTKMHGLGNDFIVINNLQNNKMDWSNLAKKLCHRTKGIGADGIMLISSGENVQYKMVIYNADGSLAKMCGNAIRCFGKYLYDKGLTKELELTVDTDSGLKKLFLTVENQKVISVNVDMGVPIFDPKLIPLISENNQNQTIEIEGKQFSFTAVSMGNPHAVVFVENLKNYPLHKIGPLIEKHPMFPDKVNVEFVEQDLQGNLHMRVWERGVGETQACGTGACAVFVASALENKVSKHGEVNLLGGKLKITWDGGHVFMDGPAETVFEGQVAL